jgi:hypothetical protein
METTDSNKAKPSEKQECFVIMPIADPDGYGKGHFQRVYEDLITPACGLAGYTPVRADDVKQTNLIHLDVLQKLIESPMAICDLSGRNPNVLFELGLRQAFDKPVVLIQEFGTPKIFDIAPLRYSEYRKERVYNEVLEDQKKIAEALSATRDAKKHSINSIVRLLSITKPASLPEVGEANRDPALQVIRAELSDLRTEIRQMTGALAKRSSEDPILRKTIAHLDAETRRDILRTEARLAEFSSRNSRSEVAAEVDYLRHKLQESLKRTLAAEMREPSDNNDGGAS